MSILDNIYVVNLNRSKDRLNKIKKNLSNLGLKYKRFSAVDANKLSTSEIKKNLSDLGLKYKRFSSIDGNKLSISEIKKNTAVVCRYNACSKSCSQFYSVCLYYNHVDVVEYICY